MEKKQNVPVLRFQGFSSDWGKYNLNMLSGLITKGTTPLDKSGKGNVNFVKIENIDANTGKIHITQKISQKEHNGYLKRSQLKENDILFSIAGTLGRVAVVNTNILPANTNQALAIIRLKKGHFKYIKTYLQGKAVANFLKANPTVGAQPNLSLAQVGSLEIIMPEKSEEQGNIADFFQCLDELIFRAVSKIQKLQQFRQAMLTKLFPREGAAEPELRFRGFSGKWKSKKMKNLGSFLKGKLYSKKDIRASGIPLILYGRLYTQYELVIDDVDTFAIPYENSVWSIGGEVIIPASGETAEDIAIASVVKQKGILLGGDLNIIRPNDTVSSAFLALSISYGHIHNELAKRAQGKSIVHIHNSDLGQLDIRLPSFAEQCMIGQFFENLDTYISLQQKKLEQMQRLKAALLEKMFV